MPEEIGENALLILGGQLYSEKLLYLSNHKCNIFSLLECPNGHPYLVTEVSFSFSLPSFTHMCTHTHIFIMFILLLTSVDYQWKLEIVQNVENWIQQLKLVELVTN